MGRGLSFLLGAVTGAAAALLLSPNTGERNRALLAEKVDYCSAHGEQAFQQATDAVCGKVREVNAAPVPTSEDIRVKINEARDRIADQLKRNQPAVDVEADIADVAQDITEDVSSAAEAVKETLSDN